MKKWLALVLIVIFSAKRTAQTQESANLNELRRKLDEAVGQIQRLTVTVEELRAEVARLKQTSPQPLNSVNGKRSDNQNRVIAEEPKEISTPNGFIERIIARDLGSDERGDLLVARPEIFIQSRYSAAPIKAVGRGFRSKLQVEPHRGTLGWPHRTEAWCRDGNPIPGSNRG